MLATTPSADPQATPAPYLRAPIETVDGIPVFSQLDDYLGNYEQIANDHLAHQASTGQNPFMEEVLWRTMEESTETLLRKYSSTGQRVLDAGVGLGRLLSRLPELHRYGMDLSLAYLAIARSKGITVCRSKIEDMPYTPDFFDVIVCTDVLEHVIDLNFCIRKLLTVLRPGGVLICRVPYREDLAPYTEKSYPYRFAHLRAFDEHSLTLLFRAAFDADILEWAPAGFWPTIARLRRPHSAPVRWLLRATFYLLRRTRHPADSSLVRATCWPIEINFVVRKR